MLDIAIEPTFTATCPFSDGKPYVGLIVSSFLDDLHWGVQGDGRLRAWLLDAGAGRTLWIDVESIDGRSLVIEQAQGVVDTFAFEAAAP